MIISSLLLLVGAEGKRESPVGKTQARGQSVSAQPTDKPEEGQGLLGKGDLGPAAGAIPMRNTCVREIPNIRDARQGH